MTGKNDVKEENRTLTCLAPCKARTPGESESPKTAPSLAPLRLLPPVADTRTRLRNYQPPCLAASKKVI